MDEVLFAGPPTDVCLRLPDPVDRATLRRLVADAQARLAAAGLRPGGAAALRLPPSLAYVVNLLATWRAGAQAILLDHRLTDHEVDRALARLTPQVVVAPARDRRRRAEGLRRRHRGASPATRTGPAGQPRTRVVQLSSGSTGPSKVIGRTAADLVAEIDRYTRIDGVPLPGERIVLLASMVHVLGLVGGLLYGLHAGVELVVAGAAQRRRHPRRRRRRRRPRPPCSACRSTSSCWPPYAHPPAAAAAQRMTTGGELVRAGRRPARSPTATACRSATCTG